MYKGGILLKIRIVAILAVVLILGFKFLSPTSETPKAQAPQSINTDKKCFYIFCWFRKDQQAPEFTLSTLTGESVKLSSLRGKTVILNFGLHGVHLVNLRCQICNNFIRIIRRTILLSLE